MAMNIDALWGELCFIELALENMDEIVDDFKTFYPSVKNHYPKVYEDLLHRLKELEDAVSEVRRVLEKIEDLERGDK